MSVSPVENLERLYELAEYATPGPWMFERDRNDGWMVVYGGIGGELGYPIIGSNDYLEPADAAFIAAFNPECVKALIDEIDNLRGEVKLHLESIAALLPDDAA